MFNRMLAISVKTVLKSCCKSSEKIAKVLAMHCLNGLLCRNVGGDQNWNKRGNQCSKNENQQQKWAPKVL